MELKIKNFRILKGPIEKSLGFMFSNRKDFVLVFEQKKEKKEIIHTFFCKTLYLYFLDKNFKVIEVKKLKPFRIYIPKKKFKYLIESFEDLKLKEGDKIVLSND